MNGKTAMSKPISNGLSIKPVAAASSPALGNLIIAAPSRQNSLRSNSISPCTRSSVAEEISLAELFRLISQLPICVVRRVGSDVDAQISSMIDAASRSKGPSAEENASPTVHFLSVGHQSAGQLLNWVQRNGLPLIFLNGDCIGGLSELKALEKSGFLAESLCPHQFELVVIGGGGNGGGNEVAEEAVEEAIRMDKRVALVELVRPAGGVPVQAKPGFRGQLAKEAANQAALMRTAIEEARSSGWTVEGDEGQRVSFWLDWQSVREGIERREQAERNRLDALFEKGKVQRISALACQFSGFHEITICPETEDSEQFEKIGLTRLSADRFLLAAKTEAKMLENVPGAREFCVSDITELFSLEHNPGKTLFCCCDESEDIELVALESAAILRALGNEVTVMSCTNYASKASDKKMPSAAVKSYEPELILHVKERLTEKGVQFVKCVPTKFEKLREPEAGRAPLLRVYAMTQGSGPASSEKSGSTGDWTPFLEEFNTVILCAGKRAQPFQALGLDKIGVHLTDSNRMFQQSNSVPNIYTLGDAPNECTGAWSCLAARQLVRRMFEGELHSIDQWDLCHTLLLPPLEYSCCGLTEGEAERRYGAAAGLNVFRDAEVPVPTVQKAKMICLKHEHDRVIGLHIIGPNAHRQLEGYALAMQLGLTRAKMEAMNSCSSRRQ